MMYKENINVIDLAVYLDICQEKVEACMYCKSTTYMTVAMLRRKGLVASSMEIHSMCIGESVAYMISK